MLLSRFISLPAAFNCDGLVSVIFLLLCTPWTFKQIAADQQFCVISPQTTPPRYDSIGKVESLATLRPQLCGGEEKCTCFECSKVHHELKRYEYFAGCQYPKDGAFNNPDLTCKYDIKPCSTQNDTSCYPKLLEIKGKVKCKVFLRLKLEAAKNDEMHYCPDHCAAAEAITFEDKHWICNDCANVCATKFSQMKIKKMAFKHCNANDSCLVDGFDCPSQVVEAKPLEAKPLEAKSINSSPTMKICIWIKAATAYAIAATFYYLYLPSEI